MALSRVSLTALLPLPLEGDASAWSYERLFTGGALLVALVAAAVTALYVWVASRQVRPRKMSLARLPTSPTSKRKRRSQSFLDLQQLELDRLEESALQQSRAFPLALHKKFSAEQRKWIYDTLSKVFAFLREEFVEPLAE